MITSLVAAAFRNAVMFFLSQEMRTLMSNMLSRVWAAVQVVLAKYPAAVPAVAVVIANLLAKFGFHASVTQIAVAVSAIAVFVGALVHRAVKAQARKSTSN